MNQMMWMIRLSFSMGETLRSSPYSFIELSGVTTAMRRRPIPNPNPNPRWTNREPYCEQQMS